MATVLKSGSPFLYDEDSGDIVGWRDADGSETLFASGAAALAELANATNPVKGAALIGIGGLTPTNVGEVLKNNSVSMVALGQANAPNVAVNATAGTLTGTYRYSVTFKTADGESECGAESAAVSPAGQQVNLTGIPISTSAKVTARCIYRYPAASPDTVLKQLVATISDNTTTTYTDNVPDGSLGVGVPRIDTTGAVLYKNGARIASASATTTVFGHNAHPNNTGYANTVYGAQAMAANTSGYRNTAFGIFALYANTTGARNTAGGVHAINYNTTGSDNTAWGYAALMNAVTAGRNTAVGSNAMNGVVTGSNNTAVGAESMQTLTSGEHNTAVGYHSMYAVQGGAGNAAIGYYAGVAITSGNYNVAFGMQAAISLTSGSTNTAIGFQALNNNSTGSGNVAFGRGAGYFETGSNRLWIDNTPRTDLADAQAKALVYGTFGTSAADQQLTINANLRVNSDTIRVAVSKTPTGTSAGTAGEIAWDASYLYVCTAANTWKRTALTAF